MLTEWLSSGWSIILVILGLGLIIFLHELGHFIMAKKNKVRVEVFSLGFGPAIWKFRRGETEYRISWLPLGGYVKMSGETLMDERKGEPWELTSKSPWERFQIFVAGALMNLIIAFPIGILAYVVGKYEHTNEVGRPGTAETRAGLMPGDVVVDVDGRKIDSLDKFRIEMVRRANHVKVPVTVIRNGEKKVLEVETMRSLFHMTEPVMLGLDKITPGSPLDLAGVKNGDEIVAVDGKPVVFQEQADELLRNSPGRKVKLTVRRRDEAFNDPPPFDVVLDMPVKEWWVVPHDDRLVEAIVGRVVPGNPAFSSLEPDDRIVQIDDQPVGSWADLKRMVEPAVNTKLAFHVDRDGKRLTFEITPTYGQTGKGAIGIGQKDSNVFARVEPESYFGKAGLQTGDLAYSDVEGRTMENPTIAGSGVFRVRKTDEKPVMLEVVRGKDRANVKITLKPERRQEADLGKLGFFVSEKGILLTKQSQPYRRRAFGDAVAAGLYEPYDVSIMTFEILKKLVKFEESAKGLSGPLGIIHASYSFAQLSFGNFLWLLCLITVNLGIFNLLPIPILDGGHNVLLLIEVIRKKLGKPPPSPSFVAAFQWTGLIFVLALFVFVTFNDIGRFIGRG